MKKPARPPLTLTPEILSLVAEAAAETGRLAGLTGPVPEPRLRRENRIRSIHASLAIEQNTLTLEQVTAVIAGKRVLGPPREIREVRNAFAAYEALGTWDAAVEADLLAAHGRMLEGLADDAGRYRSGGVGVMRGEEVVHMAPPARRVPGLMRNLLDWLRSTDLHPLAAGSVFHYELAFIHPFSDGNGRMARLWQTLILSRWQPLLAYLPVESVIHGRQADYYAALRAADEAGEATAFVRFMLSALLKALREVVVSDHEGDHVSDHVRALLECLRKGPQGAAACMKALGLAHRPSFRQRYVHPAMNDGLIEFTLPDKPRSRQQRYRLTPKGRAVLEQMAAKGKAKKRRTS